jgi:hypothetical protein
MKNLTRFLLCFALIDFATAATGNAQCPAPVFASGLRAPSSPKSAPETLFGYSFKVPESAETADSTARRAKKLGVICGPTAR